MPGSAAAGGLGLLSGASAGPSVRDLLEGSTPGYAFFRNFFRTWLRLDITVLASVLTILGMATNAAGSLQGLARRAYYWVYKFLTASVSIPGSDRLNREVLNWIGANVLAEGGQLVLTANTQVMSQMDAYAYRRAAPPGGRPPSGKWSSEVSVRQAHQVFAARQQRHNNSRQQRGEKMLPINYLPTFGTTWFFWRRRLFLVQRVATFESPVPAQYADAPVGDEPLVIMCLGRSMDPIKNFLDECREFSERQRASYITVRMGKTHWETITLRPMRSFDTVHFDEDEKESLVNDIDAYLDNRTRLFYTNRGIPYRRGYLLHGPPGTGKTSLSLAIASHFGLELYLLHLPSIKIDTDLERLFVSLPPRCVVLLEDIDAVGARRKAGADSTSEKEKENKNKRKNNKGGDGSTSDYSSDDEGSQWKSSSVTLSGLLNVLDGVASQEGRIVLMTSNHADKLDPALIRPGRIDRILYLGNLSRRSAELMFLRMYTPDEDTGVLYHSETLPAEELARLATEFAERLPDEAFTPAQVQGYLLEQRESARKAVEGVEDWSTRTLESMAEAHSRTELLGSRRERKEKKKMQMQTKMLGTPPPLSRASAVSRDWKEGT